MTQTHIAMNAPGQPVLQVGDWVAIYHRVWQHNCPYSRPCQVIALGARVKLSPMKPDGTLDPKFFVPTHAEILHVFASKEEGMAYCTAAFVLWQTRQDEIRKLSTARDRDVLAALYRAPGKVAAAQVTE